MGNVAVLTPELWVGKHCSFLLGHTEGEGDRRRWKQRGCVRVLSRRGERLDECIGKRREEEDQMTPRATTDYTSNCKWKEQRQRRGHYKWEIEALF